MRPGLSLELKTNKEDKRPVYVVGNFNDWRTADPKYRMHLLEDGKYYFQFPQEDYLPETLEYKYTRGTWKEAELDKFGNSVLNRSLPDPVGHIKDDVPKWRINGLEYNPKFLPKVELVSEDFEIPQLDRKRKIWALLPFDYEETDKYYPVLYLHDGQNLFGEGSPFGSWSIDKKLAVLAEQGLGELIVIAIDHAEDERISEYSPFPNARFGGGNGRRYVQFMANTLKPFIDQEFRTLPQREFTGIGGSSLGGLISIYAGFLKPDIYGKLMIFSPSLWIAPKIYFNAIDFRRSYDSKVYIYGGGEESTTMLPNLKRFKQALETKEETESKIYIHLSVDPTGQHTEDHWGAEFPKAVEWLFFQPN